MREFHRGAYETAVGDGEMVTEIRVPLHADAGSAYEKVERRVGDWAVAAAGAARAARGRHDRRRPGSRWPPSAPTVTSPDAEQALVGQTPVGGAVRGGRAARSRGD